MRDNLFNHLVTEGILYICQKNGYFGSWRYENDKSPQLLWADSVRRCIGVKYNHILRALSK